jgi:hypothetical protein
LLNAPTLKARFLEAFADLSFPFLTAGETKRATRVSGSFILQSILKYQEIPFTILKGSVIMAPINLKIASIVKPSILKGSSTSQMIGSSTINNSARGQHITNRIHHKIITSNVLISIMIYSGLDNKWLAKKIAGFFKWF